MDVDASSIRVNEGPPASVRIGLTAWPDVSFEVCAVLVDGIPRVTRLTIEPAGGSSPGYVRLRPQRPVPIRRLTQLTAQALALDPDRPIGILGGEPGPTVRPRRPYRSRSAASPESLAFSEEVADVAVTARVQGRPMLAAVAEAFQVSRPTAERYVADARSDGFLDSRLTTTPKISAGEKPETISPMLRQRRARSHEEMP
jgi:hypothetical protein